MVCSRLACDDCTFGLAQPSRISFFWQTKLGTHNQLFESCKMVSLSFNSEVLRYLYVYGYTVIRGYIRGYTGIYGYTGIPYTVLANPNNNPCSEPKHSYSTARTVASMAAAPQISAPPGWQGERGALTQAASSAVVLCKWASRQGGGEVHG